VDDEPAPTWFNVATAVGDRLVPDRADWVLLHIRTRGSSTWSTAGDQDHCEKPASAIQDPVSLCRS
jgi:hypothetical protein